nr:glutamine synthetase leaf isozyme, chloroplastic [Ipomoea batatas]
MAEILAPSAQWQVRLAKKLTEATLMVSRMWGSLGLGVQGIMADLQGVANRGCLIHVGRDTEKNGKALLAETTVLWEPKLEAEALGAQKLTLNVLCS